jgi:hypothetical protein
MDRWMDGWMDGWMNGWMNGWMDGWIDGWMDRQDRLGRCVEKEKEKKNFENLLLFVVVAGSLARSRM